MLQRLWLSLRAAVIATAVFWAAINIVDKLNVKVPLGLADEAVFFVIFFCGLLMVKK
ncbi:MAG TPA: hypothetical protein VMI56_10560 [Reyranella sp.]|nr:hypothetical protein [Reyranella sp.]